MRLKGIGCAFLSFWVLVWVTPVLGQAPGLPLTSVLVSPVEEREIRSQIDVIGTVEAQLSTTLSAETAGLAQRFDLKEGDFVEQEKTLIVQLKQTDREIQSGRGRRLVPKRPGHAGEAPPGASSRRD